MDQILSHSELTRENGWVYAYLRVDGGRGCLEGERKGGYLELGCVANEKATGS